MCSAGIPEHKLFLPGGGEDRDPLWRINCHFLVTKVLIPVTCWVTELLQSFFPSFIHVAFALLWGIRAQLPAQKNHFCGYITCKKSQDTSRVINLVHVNPTHPNSQFLHNSGPSTGFHLLQTPGNVGCCEHFSTAFVPWKCPNKSPK